jgi:SRSO17 transposase
MDVDQIRRLGRELPRFLEEFGDCFGRCDTREYLGVYVKGQMSDLQRKSVEPMALRAGVPPRSLQAFLGLLHWDEERMVDRLQHIVVRDHSHPWAIGIVDETGCEKDGDHTACAQRQWCGSLGKIENCVVSVHLGYAVGDFHCVLDSDLFVPKSWANDAVRRREVGMPDEVAHRSKPQIALAQIERALANGVRVAAWTFDEHYGQSYEFLDALDRLGQTYVAEVPCTFAGWVKEPAILYRPTSQKMRRQGRKRTVPRLSKTAAPVSEVRNLLNHSPVFTEQPWTLVHLKNGANGPLVREVKTARFFMRRQALPTRAYWLIVTRELSTGERKFFVSNASPGSPLEWVLHVAYSRWPVEQCFREEKDELGFDHFEVRGWQSIHRHLYLSQVSHLFLNRMRLKLVAQERADGIEEPGGDFFPRRRRRPAAAQSTGESDRRANPLRLIAMASGATDRATRRADHSPGGRRGDRLSPSPQYRGQGQPHTDDDQRTVTTRHRPRSNPLVFG